MEKTIDIPQPEIKKTKNFLRIFFWVFYTIFCIVLFIFFKIPNDRIYNYVDSQISNIIIQQGITFTSAERDHSVIFGPSYTLKDVTVHFPPPYAPQHIDQIKASASMLSLLMGKIGGTIIIKNGPGTLKISGSFRETAQARNGSFSFSSKKIDLSKLGFHFFTNLQGSILVDSKGSLEGNLNNPSTLEGNIQIKLSQLTIESQKLMGFNIPKLNVLDGEIYLVVEKAKMRIKEFKIGKPERMEDDLFLQVTGEINLSKEWMTSLLDLKTKLKLSENILKSFNLLDAILGSGKQTDGTYRFSLTGPAYSPVPLPLKE